MNQINLIPAAVQIRAAIGASVAIRLNAFKADGTPFDLTPYTITAPFGAGDGATPTPGAWVVTVEASSVLLTLSAADTATLAPLGKSMTWHWDVWLMHTTAPERLLYAHGDLGLQIP